MKKDYKIELYPDSPLDDLDAISDLKVFKLKDMSNSEILDIKDECCLKERAEVIRLNNDGIELSRTIFQFPEDKKCFNNELELLAEDY